mmetsp:Transcript_83624/g.139594  ORF Transcript_83624/g.139594 Transcript_83624/m.139594 type:complete len:288 (-) Transcript_83624:320-1183(-)
MVSLPFVRKKRVRIGKWVESMIHSVGQTIMHASGRAGLKGNILIQLLERPLQMIYQPRTPVDILEIDALQMHAISFGRVIFLNAADCHVLQCINATRCIIHNDTHALIFHWQPPLPSPPRALLEQETAQTAQGQPWDFQLVAAAAALAHPGASRSVPLGNHETSHCPDHLRFLAAGHRCPRTQPACWRAGHSHPGDWTAWHVPNPSPLPALAAALWPFGPLRQRAQQPLRPLPPLSPSCPALPAEQGWLAGAPLLSPDPLSFFPVDAQAFLQTSRCSCRDLVQAPSS